MEQVENKKETFLLNKPKELVLQQFELGDILGTGSFARVRIAKQLKTNKFFAVKVVKKAELIRLKQVDHMFNELRILNNLTHNFIVKLEGYMQDERRLYLVEELINGGELFTFLRAMKKFDIETAQFYAGHIVLVFEYLHSMKIIYRDLKPENVLINKSGYLKLCDFGFAKYCESRTYTLCGTPEYLSPEILMNRGHGKSVDWWTLGIFIYELLCGIDPFADEEPLKIYDKILKGKVKFPHNFDKNAKSLIKKLLQIDLSKRFGNLVGGVSDIKCHKFFNNFDFYKLANMELKPPYVPRVTSDYDICNFQIYPDSFKNVPFVSSNDDPFLNW